MLPFKNGQCRHCKTSLAVDSHEIHANLIPAESHTLEELQHAHNRFMFYYDKFVANNKRKHTLLCASAEAIDTISTATLNLFYVSEEFKQFEDEFVDGSGTSPAKFGERYKGFLVDPQTPLENYLVDTLHFSIVIENIVMKSLILPLVQELEDRYPGMGIFTFYIA